ncbi:MAG TPA: M20/M25/M40 family metallo-hydrolase [Thermoleophilaceae bacterium]|nr:M20/M25/M40 family metallo-hydrolase [Thermoleophilaceae bacterium]
MDDWVATHAAEIARRAPRELEALVAVSSPSGDVHGAEECAALCAALAPESAEVERIPCSSPGHAPDLLLRVRGTGAARVLLLGHVDTVVTHAAHRRMELAGGRYTGSGTIDMKGGDVLALGVLRALAGRTGDFAEAALLLVCDEEWRRVPFAHADRFTGWDACLCFEAGERGPDGGDAVIVRRKAAGTLRVTAHGRASHAGASPEKGRNALLALAAAARTVAGHHAPDGPDRLTAVPTVLNSGEALNVVPAAGELMCDIRADELAPIEALMASVPDEHEGVRLDAEAVRLWPGMHTEDTAAPVLGAAAEALGRPLTPGGRGGASDASHIATAVPLTIDGLGPRGGNAHHPDEFLLAESLQSRAEVALAVAQATLA